MLMPTFNDLWRAPSLGSRFVDKHNKLTDQQVDDFSVLLKKAHAQQQDENISAKQALSRMSAEEIGLVQKATSLSSRITVHTLSNEGSINLLVQPDKTGMVDLNNDGIVEVGVARMITFPPVNAPLKVKQAWANMP